MPQLREEKVAKSEISSVLVTGAAGFIGSYVAHALLDLGIGVIGIDNLNDYYDTSLKLARLARLQKRAGFAFHKLDIADHEALTAARNVMSVDRIIHLAAQAGVRYSIENPFSYERSNLLGHLSILELARRSPKRPLLIYASSSSVYGANQKTPFSESDPVNDPVSLYAATKRSNELMSESYARLYGLAQIGLRFFTVYGPWGRPDMAYWTFTENILDGKPIKIFNRGDLQRDFTFIADVVKGVIAVATKPMKLDRETPHRIYNIGNNKPEPLMQFVKTIETAIGREAIKTLEPMQPGDVFATCADIDAIKSDYGYAASTTLDRGIPQFVDWLQKYRVQKGDSQ